MTCSIKIQSRLTDKIDVARVRFLFKFQLLTFIFLAPIFSAQAGSINPITYQGRILKPDGTPLETSTNFRFVIRSPDNCILWQEDQVIDLTASLGAVSALVGNGANTASGSHTFADVFNNSRTLTGLSGCDVGTDFVPGLNDDRTLHVSFNDGSGSQSIPTLTVKSVPFSKFASLAQQVYALFGRPFAAGNPTTTGQVISYNATTQSWEVTTPSTGGTVTQVTAGAGLAGGSITLSGTLSLAPSGVTAGSIGSSNFIPTLMVDSFGRITGMGSTAISIPSALSSINGLTASDQVFVVGSAGTLAAFSSAGSTNTLNIPMASAAGVAGGLLSKLDYDSFASAASLAANGTISAARGGTGLDGSAATNGQLLIGNGSGFTLGTLTAGSNITITNSAGGITIASSNGGGSVTQVNSGTGLTGGPINGVGTLSLADTAVTPGGYGAANYSTTLTVDQQGRLTAAGSTLIAINGSQITGGTISLAQVPDLDASKMVSGTLANARLPLSGASTGNVGSSTYIPTLSIDAFGRITSYGSAAVSTPAAITSINGLTASEQIFVVGTSGTMAAFSSAGSTNTLNIPMASAAGVAGGLLSKIDYDSFVSGVSLAANGTISAGRGGTGLDGSSAALGQLLIGNGSGYSLGTLISGSGISIVNQAGSITISANNSGSVTQVNTGAGLVGGPITGVGTISLGTTGVVAGSVGSSNFIPQIAFDSYGRITAVGSTAVAINVSALSGTLSVSQGGTGLDASSAANGSLLIGNGSGFGLGTLVGANGILLSSGAGSVGISTNADVSASPNTLVIRDGSGNTTSAQATATSLRLDNGGAFVTVSNPIGANYSMVLPANIGTPGQVLTTNGTSALSWTTLTSNGSLDSLTDAISSLSTQNLYLGSGVGVNYSGNYNTGAGILAMQGTLTTTYNTAFGYAALNRQGSSRNTAFGSQTMRYMNGGSNTALGAMALQSAPEGSANVAIGDSAAGLTSTGTLLRNVFVGFNAGFTAGSTSDNVIIGASAGLNLSSGSNNIVIGSEAGDAIGAGSNNIIIGRDIDTSGASSVGELTIGNLIFGNGLTVTDSTISSGSAGIGVRVPRARFEVNGDSRATSFIIAGSGTAIISAPAAGNYSMILPGSIGTPGQVLTTDGTSALSWTTVSGGGVTFPLLSTTRGSVGSPVYSFSGDSDTGLFSPGEGKLSISSNGTTRVFIEEDGQIGFGAAPNSTVPYYFVGDANDDVLVVQNNSAGSPSSIQFRDETSSQQALFGYHNGFDRTMLDLGTLGDFAITTNFLTQEKFRITNGGSVGIGVTVPTAKLDLQGPNWAGSDLQIARFGADVNPGDGLFLAIENTDAVNRQAGLDFNSQGTRRWGIGSDRFSAGNNDFYIRDWVNAADRMYINAVGSIGIGNTSPLARLDVEGSIRGTSQIFAGAGTAQILAPGSGNYSFSLPNSIGTAGQVLSTDGTGALSWSSVPSNGGIFLAASTTEGTPGFAFNSDPDVGLFNPGANSLGISTAGLERFRITSGGSFGFGTTNPVYFLHARKDQNTSTQSVLQNFNTGASAFTRIAASSDTSSANLTSYSSGNAASRSGITLTTSAELIFAASSKSFIGNSAAVPMYFVTSDLVRGVLDENGNMGIGTTAVSTGARLEVTGGAIAGGNRGEFRLKELLSSPAGTNYVSLMAPASITSNVLLELPSTNGAVGQALALSGSGTLGWVTPLTSGGTVRVANGAVGTPSISFTSDTDTGIYLPGVANLALATAGTQRISITNTGVGIGVASPTVALDVLGDIKFTGSLIDASDARLKKDIQPLESSLDLVKKIKTYSYKMKDDPVGYKELGVLAHEIYEISPFLVRRLDSENGYLGVNYQGFIIYSIKAIQEMDELVTNLQDENQRLKQEIQEMKSNQKRFEEQLLKMNQRLDRLSKE